MILALSLLVLLVPGLLVSTVLGSRPGECKPEKDDYFTRDCTVDEDCKDPDKKCCPTPSGGMVCRQPAQTCSKLDCGSNATCYQSSTSSLPFCDNCNPNQCQNDGTCKDGVDSHSCTCPDGFTGDNCEINIDECSNNPCENGGTCTDQVNSYMCTCPQGYTGNTCNVNIDECSNNPCENGGTCTDQVNSYMCTCPPGYIGNTCNVMCALTNPGPCEKPFETETAAGGWTVFQRRCNGCVLFNRTMAEYVTGFGNPEQEFWLGLDNLHAMTSQQTCELRVDLQLFNGKKGFAVYSNFLVGPSSESYTLTFDAKTSGDLNDWLQYHNGKPFTTDGFCAESLNSGWWFYTVEYCGAFPLNSPYSTDAVCNDGLCPFWLGFENYSPYDSIKTVELRFRPMRP